MLLNYLSIFKSSHLSTHGFFKASAVFITLLGSQMGGLAHSEETDQELVDKLSNPIAALISVPMTYDYNENIGANKKGSRSVFKIQPVIPFALSEDWNVISRTIIPIIDQNDIVPGSGRQTGLGDIRQSINFAPVKPTQSGLIWGAGVTIWLPTASHKLLGTEKWAIGPSAVGLVQKGNWTMGFLGNHVWSVAGKSSRADVSNTFLQPFFTRKFSDGWALTFNTETNYNWEASEWSVPLQVKLAKLMTIGGQKINFRLGTRYWAVSPTGGPKGWGLNFEMNFLFPR